MFVRHIARSFALVVFAVSSIVAGVPRVAVAGDCPGMLDYEYSGGECHDKTGDTYDTMNQMYDDSYHQQQSMLDRGRSLFNNGFGTNAGPAPRISGPSPQLKRAMALSLFTHQRKPSDAIDRFVGRLGLRTADAAARRRLCLPKASRSSTSTGRKTDIVGNFAGRARAYFVQVAYYLYRHENVDSLAGESDLRVRLGMAMGSRTLTMSDVNKRRVYDAVPPRGDVVDLRKPVRYEPPRCARARRVTRVSEIDDRGRSRRRPVADSDAEAPLR